MYQLISTSLFMAKGFGHVQVHVLVFIASLLVVVAGSVAVAAQNLHLPTLKACLGMQIIACVASMINMICALMNMALIPSIHCYYDYGSYNSSSYDDGHMCETVEKIHSHFYAGALLIHAVLLAISVTLAVFCCKVLNCCVPSPKVPVITIQASMSSTEETVRTSAGK
uniref:Uncharacterized protein n=1 Tax=Monopterus albus TaxID=43700 RepID=A0A3Q3KJC1_MONAL